MRTTQRTNSWSKGHDPHTFVYTFEIMLPQPWQDLPEPKTLGEHIRLARMKRRWPMKELGQKVKVNAATISNWEKSHGRPNPPCIRRLKAILPEIANLPNPVIYPDFPLEVKTMAERVKQDRLSLDMSQTEYANKLGLCVDAIRYRESGRCLKPLSEKDKEIASLKDLISDSCFL